MPKNCKPKTHSVGVNIHILNRTTAQLFKFLKLLKTVKWFKMIKASGLSSPILSQLFSSSDIHLLPSASHASPKDPPEQSPTNDGFLDVELDIPIPC